MKMQCSICSDWCICDHNYILNYNRLTIKMKEHFLGHIGLQAVLFPYNRTNGWQPVKYWEKDEKVTDICRTAAPSVPVVDVILYTYTRAHLHINREYTQAHMYSNIHKHRNKNSEIFIYLFLLINIPLHLCR